MNKKKMGFTKIYSGYKDVHTVFIRIGIYPGCFFYTCGIESIPKTIDERRLMFKRLNSTSEISENLIKEFYCACICIDVKNTMQFCNKLFKLLVSNQVIYSLITDELSSLENIKNFIQLFPESIHEKLYPDICKIKYYKIKGDKVLETEETIYFNNPIMVALLRPTFDIAEYIVKRVSLDDLIKTKEFFEEELILKYNKKECVNIDDRIFMRQRMHFEHMSWDDRQEYLTSLKRLNILIKEFLKRHFQVQISKYYFKKCMNELIDYSYRPNGIRYKEAFTDFQNNKMLSSLKSK